MAKATKGAFGKAAGAVITKPVEYHLWKNAYEPILINAGESMAAMGGSMGTPILNDGLASASQQYIGFGGYGQITVSAQPQAGLVSGGSGGVVHWTSQYLDPNVYYQTNTPATPTPAPAKISPPNPAELLSLPDGVKVISGGIQTDISPKLEVGDNIIIQWLYDGVVKAVQGVVAEIDREGGQYRLHFTSNEFTGNSVGVVPLTTYNHKSAWNIDLVSSTVWVWVLGGKGMKKKKKRKAIKLDFTGMVLPQEVRDSIQGILMTFSDDNKELLFTKWGLGTTLEKGKGMAMLFYGVPGTGKTKCAEIIAAELGLKVKLIDPAMIWSSEPGEAERVIKAAFEEAKKKGDQLLLFDECETLVANRNGSGQILAAQTNALLTSLEKYDGVTIFTTNRTPQLDPAFDRRLQLKVEFPAPDFQTRLAIWKKLVPKKMPLGDCVNFERLATSNLTGGYIKNVILNAARRAVLLKCKRVLMAHFETALMDELNGMAAFAECDETPAVNVPGIRTSRGVDIRNSITRKELSDERRSALS